MVACNDSNSYAAAVRDQQLQQLVDKAAAEREAQRERETAQIERAAEKVRRAPPPPNPIRFMVYARMHDGGMSFWWFLPLSVFVGVIFLARSPWFYYPALVYSSALTLRLAIYGVGLLRGYARFKRFPGELRVQLEGWDALLDEQILGDPEYWQPQVTVEVALDELADRAPTEAALDLFLPAANRRIYDNGLDTWERNGLRVAGSLNVWVLGALYRLIQQLDWIHRRSGEISRIALTKQGTICSYSRTTGD
jgi:hypothetical protein